MAQEMADLCRVDGLTEDFTETNKERIVVENMPDSVKSSFACCYPLESSCFFDCLSLESLLTLM